MADTQQPDFQWYEHDAAAWDVIGSTTDLGPLDVLVSFNTPLLTSPSPVITGGNDWVFTALTLGQQQTYETLLGTDQFLDLYNFSDDGVPGDNGAEMSVCPVSGPHHSPGSPSRPAPPVPDENQQPTSSSKDNDSRSEEGSVPKRFRYMEDPDEAVSKQERRIIRKARRSKDFRVRNRKYVQAFRFLVSGIKSALKERDEQNTDDGLALTQITRALHGSVSMVGNEGTTH